MRLVQNLAILCAPLLPNTAAMRLLLTALLLFPIAASAQLSRATYTVTFESTWSGGTHPDDFPPGPHFSGLIGAAHGATATLWEPGQIASPGIESMAETGSKALLQSEVNDLITAGGALAVLSGGGIGTSPGSVMMTFELNTDFPLVSLVSMVAPSPDWFVGVNSLELFDGANWSPMETITLFTYDAGTDSGLMYTSPDADTQPPDPITLIEGYPFFYEGGVREVGTFEFVLDNVVAVEDHTPSNADVIMLAPYPNPASARSTLRIDVGATQAVRVEVFGILGRRVHTVHDGVLTSGAHAFAIDTRVLPAGVYVVRMATERGRQSQRIVVR